MKIKHRIYLLAYLLLFFLLNGCQNNPKFLKRFNQENNNYDKFKDQYEKQQYLNVALNLKIDFDSDWNIKTQFKTFDKREKKYSRFFASERGEVLFIGYNDNKKLGVRSSCETISLKPQTYFEMLKKQQAAVLNEYKLEFIEQETVIYQNIEVFQVVYKLILNQHNQFMFHSIIFISNNNMIKIDFWMEFSLYEAEKDYLKRIMDSIDLIKPQEE